MANSKWNPVFQLYMKYVFSWPKAPFRKMSQTGGSSKGHPVVGKPFQDIPGPRGLPLLGSMVDYLMYSRKVPNGLHKFIHEVSMKYGPVSHLKIGPMAFVLVRGPADIKEIMKHEGKHPKRIDMESWKMYRKDRGRGMGLLLSDGEEWQRHRTAVNYHMMRPHSVALHTNDFIQINKDLLQYLAEELKSGGNGRVEDIRHCLFLWAFEAGCSMIYEERFGCLSRDPPGEVRVFVDATQGVLNTSEALLGVPPKIARALRLPIWKSHCGYWDTVFEIGKKFAEKKIDKIKSDMVAGRSVSGLIASMLQRGSLDLDDITGDIIDLMGAAVDTTSLTMLYTLHLLSKYPDKQEKLYDETVRVRTSDGVIGHEQLRDMPYIKAVVKEVLRLFPVASFLFRTTADDAIVGGYSIPKGTLINIPLWSVGRDPATYRDPDTFNPERWLKGDLLEESIHPFANLHFGYGPRSCIGRRVAELEIYLLLSQIIQRYRILDGSPDRPVETQMKTILVPKDQVDIVFKERHGRRQ